MHEVLSALNISVSHAADVAEALKSSCPSEVVFAYGDEKKVFVGCGIPIYRFEPGRGSIDQLCKLIDASLGQWLFCLFPFETNIQTAPVHVEQSWCPILLVKPNALFMVEDLNVECLVNKNRIVVDTSVDRNRASNFVRADKMSALEFDVDRFDKSNNVFKSALSWVQKGEERRLTVSRLIQLPDNTDFIESFRRYSPRGNERVLLWSDELFKIVGQSPELLAIGSRKRFMCHKLSGTAPILEDDAADSHILHSFLIDSKIDHEHKNSIDSAVLNLSRIGSVKQGARKLEQLEHIRHFRTTLEVSPFEQTSTSKCIISSLPSGAAPAAEGVARITEIEGNPRNAYYGLSGLIFPDGSFSFSQVLRCIYHSVYHGAHTRVGAAVTKFSKPKAEYEETQSKLNSIKLIVSAE